MTLTAGTRLGPYQITASIGAGGMGEVYRATDTRLGRTVAIKILPPDLAADPDPSAGSGSARAQSRADRRRRFEQEARSVSALNHPHICTLYDIGSASVPGVSGAAIVDYLVRESLEGQTLAERLGGGRAMGGRSGSGSGDDASAESSKGRGLPLSEALDYAVQVADALAKAHRLGIVHRDIKPGNVMLTKEGAKLLDFGLAKSTPSVLAPADAVTGSTSVTREAAATATGLVVGTVPYMAPEQLEGREADARTDIFAFGATLYEMVSGRRAFEESSSASVIAAIMTRDPEPLSTLVPVTPPSLDRLVHQCLAKDPDKRWQSAGDLARQLEWIAEDVRTPRSSTSVVAEALPAPAARWRRRFAGAGLALVLFTAIGAAAFLLGQRTADRPHPSFRRLTFRRGAVEGARFLPDGQNIVFTARWEGDPRQVFSVRFDSVDATLREGLQGLNIVAVSSRNELALLRNFTLARAPLAGGAPRTVASRVSSVDWSPDGSQMAVTRGATAEGPSRVEYPLGKVIYKSQAAATAVRISPRGDLLAFLDSDSGHGHVVVIDTAGRKKVESAYHDGLEPPAWTADGREVWFSVSVPGARIAIRALDLSGRERDVLTDPVLRLRDISRDGRVLLSADDRTYSINGRSPGSTSERNLTWYNWSLLEDMSADGRTIVFTEGGESDSQNGWNTFVRPTDGSPPQRFDEFVYAKLSPDGKWLAGMAPDKDRLEVKFVPTGAGEGRFVTHGRVAAEVVGWLPDSSGIVYWVVDRVMLAMLDGRPPTPITPEGWVAYGMGPGGKHVLAVSSKMGDLRMLLYSIDGREQRLLPGVADDKWVPVGWDADGRRMRAIAKPVTGFPLRVFRVDPITGDAQPWKEIGGQLDRAGLGTSLRLRFSADGESYAYNYPRTLSTLYIVEGLR